MISIINFITLLCLQFWKRNTADPGADAPILPPLTSPRCWSNKDFLIGEYLLEAVIHLHLCHGSWTGNPMPLPLSLSKAAVLMPQSPSRWEKDEDSQEALWEGSGGVWRDGLWQDMQDNDEITSANEYRLREISLSNEETPDHQQRDSSPLREKASITRFGLTEAPSFLPTRPLWRRPPVTVTYAS